MSSESTSGISTQTVMPSPCPEVFLMGFFMPVVMGLLVALGFVIASSYYGN